jgi:predicted site-specific integrase-resolvase
MEALMKYRTLKPQQFLDEFYPDSGIGIRTVYNWLDRGLLTFVLTPTGKRLVVIDEYVLSLTARTDL